MRNINKRNNGITLIALVITVIVLLILAGVGIGSLLRVDEILEKAKWTAYLTEYESVEEAKILYATDKNLDKYYKQSKSVDDKNNMYPVLSESIDVYSEEILESLRNTIMNIENLKSVYDLTDYNKVQLRKVDMAKINMKTQKQYVINTVTGMLYSIEAEVYKEIAYHTPRHGQGLVAETIKKDVNITNPGIYTLIIDADQLVSWDSIQIAYQKNNYVKDAITCTAYVSNDEMNWQEITLGNPDFRNEEDEKIEKRLIQNAEDTQYIKLCVDVKMVDGKLPNIEYIMVNFYKYKELGIIPIVEKSSNIEKIAGLYTTVNSETSGILKQTIKVPNIPGEYILDLNQINGTNMDIKVTTPEGNIINVQHSELTKTKIPAGSIVEMNATIQPGETIGSIKVLKKDTITSSISPTIEEKEQIQNWVTVKKEKYAYNNGGSGFWYECLINDKLVGTDGIIIEDESAKQRIKVTYQTYSEENNGEWSKHFSNIQDAEDSTYLKLTVNYQVIEGNEYQGDLNNNKIKINLHDGSWKIKFYDENGKYCCFERLYFNKSNNVVEFTLPEFKKIENKKFIGWKIEEEIVLPGNVIKVSKNIDCYSIYADIYKITYDVTGGTGTPEQQEKVHGQILKLSNTKPTKTGYDFIGWSLNANDLKVDYTGGSSFEINQSTTLYAVWKLKTYTITYNANGGKGEPDNQTKEFGKTLKLSNVSPSKFGYAFLGWSISKDATTVDYKPEADFTLNADTTLYAVWEKSINDSCIGDYIDLGNDPLGVGNTQKNWRILNVEEDKTYVILASLLPIANAPKVNNILNKGDYYIYSQSTRNDLLSYFDSFSETSKWNYLANGIPGATVVGTPSYDLIQKSWNKNSKMTVAMPTNPTVKTYGNTAIDLYTDTKKSGGYWLSTIVEGQEKQFYAVYCTAGDGLSNYHRVWTASITSSKYGLRPVVCLPDSVSISRKSGTDVWQVNK